MCKKDEKTSSLLCFDIKLLYGRCAKVRTLGVHFKYFIYPNGTQCQFMKAQLSIHAPCGCNSWHVVPIHASLSAYTLPSGVAELFCLLAGGNHGIRNCGTEACLLKREHALDR